MNATRTSPRQRHGAFTLTELSVVVCVIGMLASIAVPTFLRSRTQAQKNTCINNLRQIDTAIQEWAFESRKRESAPVTSSDIAPFLRGNVVCPSGGITFDDSYSLSTLSAGPLCERVPQTHVWPDANSAAARNNGGGGNGTGNGGGNGNGNGNGQGNGNGYGQGNDNGGGSGHGLAGG